MPCFHTFSNTCEACHDLNCFSTAEAHLLARLHVDISDEMKDILKLKNSKHSLLWRSVHGSRLLQLPRLPHLLAHCRNCPEAQLANDQRYSKAYPVLQIKLYLDSLSRQIFVFIVTSRLRLVPTMDWAGDPRTAPRRTQPIQPCLKKKQSFSSS